MSTGVYSNYIVFYNPVSVYALFQSILYLALVHKPATIVLLDNLIGQWVF